MKNLLVFFACFATFIAAPLTIQSQETQSEESSAPRYVRIVLQNGGIYEGEVVSSNSTSFVINTLMLGEMEIRKTSIASLINIDADQVGSISSASRSTDLNPQASRYYFAPSAFQLKKGEGYYQNAWFIYNQISYGFTDYLTVGMSMTPFGTGGTVKIGKPISDNVHVSIGGIGVLPFTDDLNTMGIGFANITFGDERRNFTLSYGHAFYSQLDEGYEDVHIDAYTDACGEYHPSNPSLGGDNNGHYDSDGIWHSMYTQTQVWFEETVNSSTPLISIAAMIEVNSSIWLITENYIALNSDTELSIISIGVRKASKKRDVLWDFSMIAIPSEEIAGIPWLSCTVPF